MCTMSGEKLYTINEALEETKYGKFNYLIVMETSLMLVSFVLETLAISYILPVAECDLNLTSLDKATLGAIGYIGIICSAHLWGYLSDTIGRRKVLQPTLIMGFIVTVISSFSTNFCWLVVTRFANGFLISAGSSTAYAYLGEFHSNERRNSSIMYAAFICSVTGFLLPGGAWLIINQDWKLYVPYLNLIYKPWRFYIIISGLPGFLSGIILLKIPESPKFLLSLGHEEKTLNVLRKIYAMNTGKDQKSYPVSRIINEGDISTKSIKLTSLGTLSYVKEISKSMWEQTAPLFQRKLILITTLTCYIQFWIFFTGHGLYLWFPEIMNYVTKFINENPMNQYHPICDIFTMSQGNFINGSVNEERICIEKLEFSTFYYALMLESIFVLLFAIMLAGLRIISRTKILFIIMVTCGLCGIGTVIITLPQLSIYLYIIQLLCVLGVSVVSAVIVDLYPTNLRAMAVCITLMFGRIGIVVGTNVVGLMLQNYCKPLFLLSGVTLIMNGFLAFLIPK